MQWMKEVVFPYGISFSAVFPLLHGSSLFAFLSFLLLQSCAPRAVSPIYPPALREGDTIAIVAPAGTLQSERVELARQRLKDMGFQVSVPSNLYRQRGYLAGTDQERAEELMAAFLDPRVKAILPGTGGYGTTRIVDRLDYKAIRRHPKILLGFSDITGLHLAIQKKTGLVTFHGPNMMWGLGSEEGQPPFAAKYQWRAILEKEYLAGMGEWLSAGYAYELPAEATPIEVLSPGVARGRLIGGNLSLISPLIGTEYEIETDGRILFIEDVREEPYRIDRYLSHLRLAGKLDRLAGVIVGVFSHCEPADPARSLSLEEVFQDYFADLGVPVIMNYPVGHIRNNATLPIGVLAELDANRKQVRLLENPVALPGK